MAAYGQDMGGNQIFISVRRGTEYPPLVVDVRAKYDETIWDVKKKVEESTGTPAEKLQIFHHKKELLDEEYKDKTLDEMNLHTGFSLLAYDLTVPPKYFPAVKRMPNGALRQCTPNFPERGDDTDGHSEGYCP